MLPQGITVHRVPPLSPFFSDAGAGAVISPAAIRLASMSEISRGAQTVDLAEPAPPVQVDHIP